VLVRPDILHGFSHSVGLSIVGIMSRSADHMIVCQAEVYGPESPSGTSGWVVEDLEEVPEPAALRDQLRGRTRSGRLFS
jgi:hypothetical protein